MSEVADREKSEDAVEVMDTPEKSKSAQIATPVSKFEESPVFNFLKNLSPIKPIKSAHTTQSINPLNFSSLPPIFASPHVASFRDSRFLQRHKLPDPSKPEFSSIGEHEDGVAEINTDTGKEQDGQNLNLRMSDAEAAVNPSYNSSMSIVESAQVYDINNQALADSFDLVPLVHEPLPLTSYRSESNMNARFGNDQNEEVTQYDWESLISASDLLIFQSPNASESSKKPVERGSTFYESIENDMIHMQSQCAAVACVEQAGDGNETENLCTQPGEGNNLPENAENNECYTGPSMNNPGERIDDEHLPGFYRGTRRRCLVFEMTGARMRHLNEQNSNFDSSTLQEPEESGGSLTHEQQQPLTNQGSESTRSALPGIGLHLNAIASTSKDYKIVNQDSSASGRLLIGPNLSVNFRTLATGQELLNDVLPVPISERDNVENSVVTAEDAQQAPGYLANEDGNPSSPKKKRRREQMGEAEACKRCNCKKSKCLKLYCECFAAGVYCVEPCACIDCFNKPIHEDTVLATRKQIESRNPLAFAPKVIRGSDPSPEIGDDSTRTPASARHKRGCNCKKSGCLKKYCECYQGGVGCSINCRCEGCKNAFGRKDGSGVVGVEHDVEEDETDKNQSIDSETPATPVRTISRQSIPQPFSSKNKPPRSSSSIPSMIVGSSSAAAVSSSTNFYTNTGYKNQSFFQLPPPKFDKHFEAIRENDEIPDFLLENSPIRGIKSSSPNGKRVSPPHNGGVSPGLRSSRKLILQSIPSFPSLTSNQ